jgi:hypothetical protein
MLDRLIKTLESSQELREAWYEFSDALVVESLKETYLNTLNGGFSSHPEDIANNLKVHKALEVVLGYYMFLPDADEFIKEANNERRAY